MYFSIKLYHGGDFDETSAEYVGGNVDFFDMCCVVDMTLEELSAMLGELGLKLEDIELFYLIPETGLPHGLLPVETQTDLDDFVNMVAYSHIQVLYAATKKNSMSNEVMDFLFTQLFEDEMIERIEHMRVEVEEKEVIRSTKKPVKKKRRIPPPNPPFRLRKKGRYSMLRVRVIFSYLHCSVFVAVLV